MPRRMKMFSYRFVTLLSIWSCLFDIFTNAQVQPHYLFPRQLSVNNDQLDDCSGYALNRGTWAELGIDNYLQHYPGGQNMSFSDYTRSLILLNFDCGIGKVCLAGQLCHPIRGRDWVVVSAVQEWNFYMNSLYESIGSSMQMVQGAAAAMIADFLPEGHDFNMIKTLVIGLLSLSGVVVLSFLSVLILPILSSLLTMTWDFVVWGATTVGSGIATGWAMLTTVGAEESVLAAEAAEAAAATEGAGAAESATTVKEIQGEEAAIAGTKLSKRSILQKRKHETPDQFQTWSVVDSSLNNALDRLRSIIALQAEVALLSAISSQDGMYGVLKDGTFLSEHPPRATLQDNAQETAQLGALAQLFKVMNVLFVIDSNPCKQQGPTTPLKYPEQVNYCSPEGVKMSLGILQDKKIVYKIRNGRLIFSKYGYPTDFLFQLAADCQNRRNTQGLTPTNGTLTLYTKGSTILENMISNSTSVMNTTSLATLTSSKASSPNSNTTSSILLPDGSALCSFPIPICDLRSPEIKEKIASGLSEAIVCREALNMPPYLF